jgi:hypothetical protein
MRNGGPEGPSFNFDREPGISEIERLGLMRELAASVEATANKFAVNALQRDPISHTLLGKIVESGPEYDPTTLAHMRKMLALRLFGLPDIAARAASDREFFDIAIMSVSYEIDELESIPGADELPDMWDIALEDLLRLQNEE